MFEMHISNKTKKVICLLIAVSLIIPIAIGIVSMFIAR